MSAGQGTPDALLFDFDGVLADTERIHHASWNATLEPFGIQFTWPEYVKCCVGVADPVVAQNLKLPDPEPTVARKQALFRRGLEENPPFLPETVALIRELAQEFRMAVVSSSFQTEIFPAIQRAGLDSSFETFVFGNEVQRLKPAPDPYLVAAERMGLARPLVIEDSPAGIAAGEAAGFEVLRVRSVEEMPRQVRQRLGKCQQPS